MADTVLVMNGLRAEAARLLSVKSWVEERRSLWTDRQTDITLPCIDMTIW